MVEEDGADGVKTMGDQMQVEGPLKPQTVAEEDGADVAKTMGDRKPAKAESKDADAEKVRDAEDKTSMDEDGEDSGKDVVQKTDSVENAGEQHGKSVTFQEKDTGKTQSGSAHEQLPLGTGGK